MLHLSRKIISANLKIGGSKMQPLSGNQRPDLLTALMNMSLVLRLPPENASFQILFKCPTPAIDFEMLQNPHVLLTLTRSTIPCACHNGVQFFISPLASWLRTRRFSELTFRPSRASNHGKTQCFATLLPFRAPVSSFFWDFLFSDLLSSALLSSALLFSILLLHLCFSSVPYCRKFDF